MTQPGVSSFIFSFSCCVHACVHVCTFAHVEVRGPYRVSSSNIIYLSFWHRVSHSVWTSLTCQGQSLLSQSWDYRCKSPCSTFLCVFWENGTRFFIFVGQTLYRLSDLCSLYFLLKIKVRQDIIQRLSIEIKRWIKIFHTLQDTTNSFHSLNINKFITFSH